jgi:hypothetical protein
MAVLEETAFFVFADLKFSVSHLLNGWCLGVQHHDKYRHANIWTS